MNTGKELGHSLPAEACHKGRVMDGIKELSELGAVDAAGFAAGEVEGVVQSDAADGLDAVHGDAAVERAEGLEAAAPLEATEGPSRGEWVEGLVSRSTEVVAWAGEVAGVEAEELGDFMRELLSDDPMLAELAASEATEER